MDVSWEELGWERLAAGVGRRRMPGWDCTIGLVAGDDAALMVDAGSSLREGAELRTQAQRLLGRRVTHLALTHPHFDHVLGAAVFSGVEVYGAVGLDSVLAAERDEICATAVREGLPRAEAVEAADLLVRPQHAVCGEWTLELGGLQVLLANVGPGHSGHDLVVLVPGAPDTPGTPGSREIVFCSDLVEESGEPQAGPDAVPSRWPAALDRLLDLGGEDAMYVPGHGSVVDARFVRAQRDALAARFGVSPR
ncbi:MBL fold metallo-hydrolase [Streptomyces sp. A3M-1-3]|uniref:MBL fold metallo-hydrolase n=1 Tax=Streptomyces sp. A3M-1-3 TaxID=2962044 RepID=UPI0020B73044|nr:MBL fold metallo-hydrolase [Streptomyces sp. A3M-1-3]MCP3817658.1 MBL fold metallo-hydrolase [Streptomyces sp. A3M-1-3]